MTCNFRGQLFSYRPSWRKVVKFTNVILFPVKNNNNKKHVNNQCLKHSINLTPNKWYEHKDITLQQRRLGYLVNKKEQIGFKFPMASFYLLSVHENDWHSWTFRPPCELTFDTRLTFSTVVLQFNHLKCFHMTFKTPHCFATHCIV